MSTHSIQLLILDVDGVLTDGKIWITPDGSELKGFHTQDGLGMKRCLENGIEIAIISGRKSRIVDLRMKDLGVTHVYQGISDKIAIFNELQQTLNIAPENMAYVGDDLADLPVMQLVGMSFAVANAVYAVKAAATMVTKKMGGDGAVREVCDYLLEGVDNVT